MTNEEAISVIENEIQIDVRLCTDKQVDKFQTALYMAISALRAEPTGDSLTLEQLRKMDGQPVWVKVIGKTGIRCDGWCEAEIREKDPFAYVWWPGSEVEDIAKIEDYGKTWACYAYPPAHIDREAWVSVEDRMPKYNIREDGELVSSKILVRCEIDKTVHLVVSKKFYTGRPGEMVHSVFRFYDEWGDIIENVSHWMPLPEPPTDLEKRIGGHNG